MLLVMTQCRGLQLLWHLCVQECYRPVDEFLEGHSLVFQADRADDPDSINNGVRHLIALQQITLHPTQPAPAEQMSA